MCFPGVDIVASLGGAALQGMGAIADARYQAAAAKHQGRQAELAAQRRAQELEGAGAQQLGALRASLAGSGNLSALEFLSDRATLLGQEIAWAKHGGDLAKAEARAAAARARQLGLRAVAGTALGAGTQLLAGFNVEPSLEQRYPVIGKVRSFAPSALRHYGL
jgi:predicted metal-dependent hydrolase